MSARASTSSRSATKPGVNGPDHHAGGDVAEHRRQPQPMRDRAEHQRRHERDEQGQPESGHGMDRLSAARGVVGGMTRSYRAPFAKPPMHVERPSPTDREGAPWRDGRYRSTRRPA